MSATASTQASDDTDGFIIRITPFPNGPIGSVEEEPPKNGSVTKTIQCGDGIINPKKDKKETS